MNLHVYNTITLRGGSNVYTQFLSKNKKKIKKNLQKIINFNYVRKISILHGRVARFIPLERQTSGKTMQYHVTWYSDYIAVI